jgi:prepilin-type N-terminal cleavage/methylation domain-containing protein
VLSVHNYLIDENFIMNNFKKGFTLIELLVVIAIISLLTTVALASLASARAKAADASIKETLTNVRTQAELYFSENNGMGAAAGTCSAAGSIFADTKVNALIDAAEAASGQPASARCVSSDNADGGVSIPPGPTAYWVVLVPLRAAGANTFWCVDSQGNSKQVVDVPPYESLARCP